MMYKLAMVGTALALGAALYEARCALGWHPRAGRRMGTGERRRDSAHSVARWTCGRCNQPVGVTDITVSTRTMIALRRQVPGAVERSRVVFPMHVVPKEKAS